MDKMIQDVGVFLIEDGIIKRLPEFVSDVVKRLTEDEVNEIFRPADDALEEKKLQRLKHCLAELNQYSEALLPSAPYYVSFLSVIVQQVVLTLALADHLHSLIRPRTYL